MQKQQQEPPLLQPKLVHSQPAALDVRTQYLKLIYAEARKLRKSVAEVVDLEFNLAEKCSTSTTYAMEVRHLLAQLKTTVKKRVEKRNQLIAFRKLVRSLRTTETNLELSGYVLSRPLFNEQFIIENRNNVLRVCLKCNSEFTIASRISKTSKTSETSKSSSTTSTDKNSAEDLVECQHIYTAHPCELEASAPFLMPIPSSRFIFDVVILHSEMVYTSLGAEIERLKLSDRHGKVLYDKQVATTGEVWLESPEITKSTKSENFNCSKISFAQLRIDYMRIIGRGTTILGCNLAQVFSSLRLLHKNVIDFAIELQRAPSECKGDCTNEMQLWLHDRVVNSVP